MTIDTERSLPSAPKALISAIRSGRVRKAQAPEAVQHLRQLGWSIEGAYGYAGNWADAFTREEAGDGKSGLIMVLSEAPVEPDWAEGIGTSDPTMVAIQQRKEELSDD